MSTRSDRPVHRPVLPRETIHWLDLEPGLVVVDGTVGAGGHARLILEHIQDSGTLVGLDRDPRALRAAARVLDAANCHLIHASHAETRRVLDELHIPAADRMLLDLGLSSDQLADPDRGFGIATGGPLDLRFDDTAGEPAWQRLEEFDEAALADVLGRYGEERFRDAIAREIVSRRAGRPVRTAEDLVDAVEAAVPAAARGRARSHPATRVFQALRILVNDELEHVERTLSSVLHDALAPGGRAVVVSFHSLEDRLVKRTFRDSKRWQNLTTTPITATPAEQRLNPRSRTAKLRAAIRR